MFVMLTTTLSEFRKHIKRYFDSVTKHEMSSKLNKRRLDSAIEKLKSGNASSINLIED